MLLSRRPGPNLAEARLKLAYTRVLAPCDGLITDLQLREGAYVHTGQAAMTLIDTAPLARRRQFSRDTRSPACARDRRL